MWCDLARGVQLRAGTLGTVRFTAAITEDEGWFVARCLEVEVASQGETFDEARANLAEALELYFEDQPDVGISGTPVIVPIDIAV
jgi:predicted RNase H-like HicB family nuclease